MAEGWFLNPFCQRVITAIFDDSLLVSAHPAGDSDEEELELSRHGEENLSKVPTAQSAM
jgi:hypothetical protein